MLFTLTKISVQKCTYILSQCIEKNDCGVRFAGLNSLVRGLLKDCDNVPEFDWLCFNDIGKCFLYFKLTDYLFVCPSVSIEPTSSAV